MFGIAAALAVPFGSLCAPLLGHTVVACGWVACGLIPFRLLWTLDTKHPALPPTVVDAEKKIYVCEVPRGRLMAAYGVMGCLGAFSSPAIWAISALGPAILPTAVALSVSCFGGATLAAMYAPSESLLKWQAPLGSAVVGLIGLSIAQFGAAMLGAPIAIIQMTDLVTAVAGIGIFSALTAVDAQAIVRSYHDANLDPAGHAIGLALNAANLLLDFLRILHALFEDSD